MSTKAEAGRGDNGAGAPRRRGPSTAQRRARMAPGAKAAIALVVAVGILAAIFFFSHRQGEEGGRPGKYSFAVGQPGPGEPAPGLRLASASGGTFDLASQSGKTVLLYFQEGLTCQPCWDQLKDIEARWPEFRAAGIDAIATITTDPVDNLKQKVRDEGLQTPVLADPKLAVSESYHANSYGMMGNSRDGHTFIVVGRDGRIVWRADYGGAPKYTMYLPVPDLLADLRKGLHQAA